ncbi:MAG: alpha/beta hydrolase, partial [Mycobacterium sp.]|nr:alpha/beta hydrolase [Mycobacterium sp.]
MTTRDGTGLAVRVYGSRAARRTVVLLHGLCVSDEVWSVQVGYLLGRHGEDIRVITYDHRGHGRSSRAAAQTYRIAQLASDLEDVLAALDVVGPITLVGHSMGGMAALAYLARSSADRTADPDGLVLVTTAAGKLAQRGLGRSLAAPGIFALLADVDRIPTRALELIAGPVCSALARIWPAQQTMLKNIAKAAAGTSVPTVIGFLPTLREFELHGTLHRIRAKTVIVSAGADPVLPVAHSHDLADAIPGAVHLHLPQSGHMVLKETPNAINEAIEYAMFPCGTEQLAARSDEGGTLAGL